MKFFQISLSDNQANWLKSQWGVETDGQLRNKLQEKTDELIAKLKVIREKDKKGE